MLKKTNVLQFAKKTSLIIIQVGILYVFSSVGTWIQQFFDLIIPGSVIGMLLLFLLLTTKIVQPQWIEAGATFLTTHLVLFFIPATVGVWNEYEVFMGKGFILVIITMISTILVMAVSGFVTEKMKT